MRTSTNINFYCRKSKSKDGLSAPVEMSIGINGERKFFQTALRCDLKTWGTKRQPTEVTKYIDALRRNVSTAIAEMTSQGMAITAESVRRCVQRGGINSYTLKDLYDDFNVLLKLRHKNGKINTPTYNKYMYMENLFAKDFTLDRQVMDITPAVIETFYCKLQGEYQESSLCCMITKLKSIIRYALDNAHLKINPFQNIRLSKGIKDVVTITDEDFEKIRGTKFSPRVQITADMFVFSCGSGTSYCDTYSLRPNDFQEINGKMCIIKPRQKTKILFYSVLLPWAQEIAAKYNYDFSHLKISNQKANENLKKIAKICNLSIKPHYHLARHYYACFLIRHKVPITSISKALGHVNNSNLTLHYAKLLTDTIVNDIGSLF